MTDWTNRGTAAIIQRQPPFGKSFIRVGLSGFGTKAFIDIREYYQSEEGTLKPTKKGLTINTHSIPAVINALCATAHHIGIELSEIFPQSSNNPAASNQ